MNLSTVKWAQWDKTQSTELLGLFICVHCTVVRFAAWVRQYFWLTTHPHAAVWLHKSCNQCVQLGAVGGMVQEKGSRECCSSWTVLHTQCTSALSSGFPLLQGNAEALDSWGGKTKHRLISYFLSNIRAKNYHNWILYVKIIASQRRDVFLRHSVVLTLYWQIHYKTLYFYKAIIPEYIWQEIYT